MFRWSKFISVLAVILVLSSSLLVTGGQVQAGGEVSITGIVSLPSGVEAETDFALRIENDAGRGTYVTIPAGSSQGGYELIVPANGSHRVSYVLSDDVENYVRRGFFRSVSHTVSAQWDGTVVHVGGEGVGGINLTLIPGQAITGSVSLPGEHVAPQGGLRVQVEDGEGVFTYATIPHMGKSVEYSLVVPVGVQRRINYYISPWAYQGYEYVRRAAYAGQSGTTTFDDAAWVQAGSTGVDINIIAGRTISGTISIPEGMEIPEKGIGLSVNTSRNNERFNQWFSGRFTPTTRSFPFDITVPEGDGFVVGYSLHHPIEGLVRHGYYSPTGVVGSWHHATALDLSSDNVSGVDMTLVTGRTISGRISLPDGDVAPDSGLTIYIQQVDGEGTNAFIPPGVSYVDYSLVVLPGEYRLAYWVNTQPSNYARQGFVGPSGAVLRQEDAAVIDVRDDNRSDMNFTLPRAALISGTVSLPAGATATADMQVQIRTDMGESVYVTIIEGENSSAYVLPASSQGSTRVYYILGPSESQAHGYVSQGYYTDSGTVARGSNVTYVNVGQNGVQDINLTLIPGQAITGRISLPGEDVAPVEGLRVRIDNQQGAFTHTVIQANHNSSEYALVVPLGDSYMVAYQISQWDYPLHNYVRLAHYGASGTSTFPHQAIQVSPGASNIDMTIMPGRTIAGTISLPEGVSVSSHVGYSVYASRNNEWSQRVHEQFAAGTSSRNFVLTVPEGEGFVVEYSLHSPVDGLVRNGYYAPTGVVGSRHQAAALDLRSDNVSGVSMTLATGRTISGRISLPDGEVAPDSGLNMYIQQMGGGGISAFIPPGANFVDYSLMVLPGEYQLAYGINTHPSSYVRHGFVGQSGAVLRSEDAAVIDVREADRADVNLTLVKASLINGMVSLPEGITATANTQVHINTNMGASVTVTIPAGESTVSYQLAVSPGTTHTISYALGDGPQYNGYVRQGFYSDAGTTTTFHNQRGHVESDSTGINLEIIPGRTISGTVALPQDFVVPAGGVRVHVAAGRNHESGHGHSVTLTAALPMAPFILTVPEGNGFGVWYSVSAPGLVGHAYYASTTAVGTWEQATLIDVGDEDVTGIHMTLITGKTISGRISLPDNDLAPAGGIRVGVSSHGSWANVHIPAGQNGADYSLVVTEGLHRIQYHLQNNYSGLLRMGYYGGQQTVSRHDEAVLVDATDDNVNEIDGINITINRAVMVTGTVALPEGTTSSSLRLSISNNQGAHTSVVIPAGASSVEYSLPVEPQSEQTIIYRIEGLLTEFVGQGFYSEGGTVSAYSLASTVRVGSTGVDGVNLTLLRGSAISGTISLPGGRLAPSGGLRVEISNNGELSAWYTIPAYANSVAYSFVVPEGGPYRVRYWIPDWGHQGTEYVRQGYYSTSGTTVFHDQATSLMVSGPLSGVNLVIMEGYKISGTVSLPHNLIAPAGGIRLSINNNEGAWSFANIPAGERQAFYALTVAPGQYRVSYSISSDTQNPLNLISRGYYGGSSLYQQAQIVDATAGDVSGIDMVLGTGVSVSGSISLPQGVTLTSRLRIQVSNNEGAWTSVTIDPQQTSAPYSLVVPPDVSQHIRYHVTSYDYAGNDIVREGYYSTNGTTSNYHLATLIRPTQNVSGVDLTILVPQVVGTVLAADNSLTSYGWVQIQSATGRHITSAGCTNDGRFSLGGLEPGDYTLRAFPSHGHSLAPSAQVAFTIPLVTSSPVELTVLLSQVQLQIVASDAIYGWVEILRHDGSGYRWYAGMGLNRVGTGFIGGLPDGNYRFKVFPGNSGDLCESLPREFVVTSGTVSPDLITVELQLPQIYGVLHGADGQPMAGGWVRLSDGTGQHVTGVGVDQNGRFAVAGLETGRTYFLRGYPNDGAVYTPSADIEVTTDTETSSSNRLVVTLTEAQITGVVSFPAGSSPRGWVEVRNSDGRWVTSTGISRQGTYSIGGLAPGDYVIQAMAPGDASYANGVPVPVTVQGATTTPITLNLSMQEVALTGLVNIPAGVAPSSVWVEVGDADENWLFTFSVDVSGNFKLPALDFSGEQTYVIKAFALEYESQLSVITSETATITLHLEAK